MFDVKASRVVTCNPMVFGARKFGKFEIIYSNTGHVITIEALKPLNVN